MSQDLKLCNVWPGWAPPIVGRQCEFKPVLDYEFS